MRKLTRKAAAASRMLALIAAASLVGASLLPRPFGVAGTLAAEEAPQDPSEMAREGLERLLRALNLMMEQIPQYEMPEILENGDIIIRRRAPSEDGGGDEAEPEVQETNA